MTQMLSVKSLHKFIICNEHMSPRLNCRYEFLTPSSVKNIPHQLINFPQVFTSNQRCHLVEYKLRISAKPAVEEQNFMRLLSSWFYVILTKNY